MGYKVILQLAALQDAQDYAGRIMEQSGAAASEHWLQGLEALFRDLSSMPTRFRIIEEQAEFSIELRHVLYHSHRVVYHVNEGAQSVHVLRVYHHARKALSTEDVPEPRAEA